MGVPTYGSGPQVFMLDSSQVKVLSYFESREEACEWRLLAYIVGYILCLQLSGGLCLARWVPGNCPPASGGHLHFCPQAQVLQLHGWVAHLGVGNRVWIAQLSGIASWVHLGPGLQEGLPGIG